MTDLGRGQRPQGDQPWYPGHAGQQPPQTGAWQQQYGQQGGYPQQGHPQQQGGYPQQGHPQQQGGYPQQYQQQGGYPQQQSSPQQSGYGGQQQYVQQGYPQQYVQQGGYPPQQAYPHQQMPQQPTPQQAMGQQPIRQPIPQQVQHPQQPSGPGPDGTDWEAEAAKLGGDPADPEAEHWEDEGAEAEYAEDEHEEYDDEEEHHSFFDEEDDSDDGKRKRKEKGKKAGRRNKGACLIVALVLLGGMGGAGYFGYGFYKTHFAPPPDYTGEGDGSVNVEIKPGTTGAGMAQVMKDADVVKSAAAFIAAYNKNQKSGTIQPGMYTLKHEMSAASAVQSLVDANGGNALVIPEGLTAAQIYPKIDAKLKLAAGTTAGVAKAQIASLGLPDYAGGNIEGFLFPTRYSITDGMKPEDLLKQMVAQAVQNYQKLDLDAGAQKIGLKSGYQVIVEASILQKEGNNAEDFGKMARALYNRLNTNATNHTLGLDTTLQYQMGRTALTDKEINDKSLPYNTNVRPGLPPGPIGNPGDEAINAVLNPTPGDWVYWIAMSPTETRFTVTYADHTKNVQEYCTAHNWGFDPKRGECLTSGH